MTLFEIIKKMSEADAELIKHCPVDLDDLAIKILSLTPSDGDAVKTIGKFIEQYIREKMQTVLFQHGETEFRSTEDALEFAMFKLLGDRYSRTENSPKDDEEYSL